MVIQGHSKSYISVSLKSHYGTTQRNIIIVGLDMKVWKI